MHAVDLVKQTEKKPRETKLGDELANAIRVLQEGVRDHQTPRAFQGEERKESEDERGGERGDGREASGVGGGSGDFLHHVRLDFSSYKKQGSDSLSDALTKLAK